MTMAPTIVNQERQQELLSDGTLKYVILSTVTDPGELPHTHLFVFQIVDTVDPKDDIFLRVGNPYDLENVNVSRIDAVDDGEQYYLASELRKEYKTLDTALDAKDAINSRINDAVKAWYSYITEFEGSDTEDYPTTDPSYEQALKDAYATAKENRKAAEDAVTASDTALTLAQSEASLAQQKVQIYANEVEFCETARVTYWVTYYGAVGSYTPEVTNLRNNYQSYIEDIVAAYDAANTNPYPNPPTAPGWNPVWTALNTHFSDPSDFTTGPQATFQEKENFGSLLDSAFASFCSNAAANHAAALSEKQLKDQDVADAVTAKEEAEAALVAAQQAEDEALAAVLAVCPDFDPLSV